MVFTNKVLNKKIIFLFSKFLVPLHYQELFDRSVLQIAEFTTVAKSLPYSLQRTHKPLIFNIFLLKYRLFKENTCIPPHEEDDATGGSHLNDSYSNL